MQADIRFPEGALPGRPSLLGRLRSRVVLDGLVRLGDVLVIAATGAAATWWRFLEKDVPTAALAALMFAVLLAALVFPKCGLYAFERLGRLSHQLPRLLLGWSATLAGVLVFLYALKSSADVSRLWLGVWWLGGSLGLIVWRVALRSQIRAAHRDGSLSRNLLVIGRTDLVRDVTERLESADDSLRVAGAVCVAGAGEAVLPALGRLGTDELLPELIRRQVDEVVLAIPWSEKAAIHAALATLRHLPIEVSLYPEILGRELPLLGAVQVGDAPLLRLLEKPLGDWRYVMKGVEDRVLGLLLLVLTAPLLAAIALAVRLSSPGPVFFRQLRHGFNRHPILVWKFRTMYVDRCDAPDAGEVRQATRDDPRITPLGRFLRRTSLDELPQLFNVLLGEMSIVGPRPHAVAHDSFYGRQIDGYLARHRVKPGITGWAQVNGFRGETGRSSRCGGVSSSISNISTTGL